MILRDTEIVLLMQFSKEAITVNMQHIKQPDKTLTVSLISVSPEQHLHPS